MTDQCTISALRAERSLLQHTLTLNKLMLTFTTCMQCQGQDPGYKATARLLLECGLCMALQPQDIKADPYAGTVPGGVLTPAPAFGLVLDPRLKGAGFETRVETLTFKTESK